MGSVAVAVIYAVPESRSDWARFEDCLRREFDALQLELRLAPAFCRLMPRSPRCRRWSSADAVAGAGIDANTRAAVGLDDIGNGVVAGAGAGIDQNTILGVMGDEVA